MKLLICDDDISTVDVISNLLTPNELGITQILRAYNGLAARERILQDRPELVLCDIGMPISNGLEVLKFIYENKIETEFAFLTCHEDFEYAKTALLYGASDYITKPFEFADLKISLQRMIASSVQKRQREQADPQTRFDSVLSSVLRQLSDGIFGSDYATVDSLLARNGLPFRAGDRWHMVVSCADMTDAVRDVWSRELLMYTIGRLHDEALVSYIGSAYTLTHTDDRFLWCTCFVPEAVCSQEELLRRCGDLVSLCAGHMSLSPTILLSDPLTLCDAAHTKVRMQQKMRRLRIHAGRILRLSDPEQPREVAPLFLDPPQIHWYLKKRDEQGFCEYISSLIGTLARSEDYTRQVMDDLRRELIHVFTACLRDNSISSGALFDDPGVSALHERAALSGDNMRAFARQLFSVTCAQLQLLTDSDDIISRAESYIREHFRENINREDVAAIVYITPNYLSKQFRSRKGMNLREFINQIRIEEAKRLLLTTNLSVSEVAGLSGYENISYFSTVFRKHTGMSPVDWRNSETTGGTAHEAE